MIFVYKHAAVPRSIHKRSSRPAAKPASRSLERYSAPALDKGIDILELLADQANGLSQKQIAEQLDRSASEIFRMLACLQERKWVRRSFPGDLYELTPRLFELAHRHPPTRRLLTAGMQQMRLLADDLGQSCHLAVLSSGTVTIVAQAESPLMHGFSVRLGGRLPIRETTSGAVLLAWAEPTVKVEAMTEMSGSDVRELESQMSQIRRRGYEQRKSRSVAGIVDLSFPVFDHNGYAAAAITVPYLSGKQPGSRTSVMQKAVERLRIAAATTSSAIGGGSAA